MTKEANCLWESIVYRTTQPLSLLQLRLSSQGEKSGIALQTYLKHMTMEVVGPSIKWFDAILNGHFHTHKKSIFDYIQQFVLFLGIGYA